VSHPSFSTARDTVFYHYGFSQSDDSDNVRDVIDASLTHGNANFVLIYYLRVTTNVITNAREIGDALADGYIRLCDAGVQAPRLHLVGFSLGAQIQAIASRTVQSRTTRRLVVGRLTGLDPGQIQTVLIPLIGRLSANDAAFVDSIHTEGVGFGDHQSIGHVSYWVNGGVAQPFCTSGINTIAQTCSHNFAPTAWAESIRARGPIFPSLQCASWDAFLANNCNAGAPVGNMGMTTSTALRGRYFLRTNNQAPFSRAAPGP
jgi:pancreatic lipase-related protein 2